MYSVTWGGEILHTYLSDPCVPYSHTTPYVSSHLLSTLLCPEEVTSVHTARLLTLGCF